MALFNFGKNKNQENVQESQNGSPSRRPTEMLGSVLSESVPGASLDVIRSNNLFEITPDNDANRRYIVITLDVNTIGGLNKRTAKSDPNKGQFIECINCGNIECYVSAEGIAADKFVIIPTEKTVDSMGEFSFLSDKENYSQFIPTVCTVDQNGFMTFEELPVTVPFTWFHDISKGYTNIIDAVSGFNTDGNQIIDVMTSESQELPAVPDMSEPDADNEGPGFMPTDNDTKSDDVNDTGVSESIFEKAEKMVNNNTITKDDENDDDLIMFNNTDDDTDDDYYQCPVCGAYIDPDDDVCPKCGEKLNGDYNGDISDFDGSIENSEDVVSEDISDDEVFEAVERLFSAGDLDLVITPQAFDVRILGENQFVPLIEERNDGWLDSYVTQMIKNANEELRVLHHENLLKSRQRFLALMNHNAEDIANKVDYNNKGTPFNELYVRLLQVRDERKDSLDEQIAERCSQLELKWHDELEQVKSSAAAAAERTYIENHSKAHHKEIHDVEISLLDELEREHSDNMKNLNEKRRFEAKRMLDIAVTETLEVVGQSYAEMVDSENRKRTELLEQITNYVDAHLKDEVAHNAVLAEAQRQKEEADRVAEEFRRKIDELSQEHKLAKDKLNDEINAAHVHEDNLKREYDSKFAAESDRYKELEAKYNELMDKYVRIDEEKAKEYENRMTTLENDRKAAEEHLAHVDMVHNKFNKVSVVVWISIAVAMFAVGALMGNALGTGKPSNGGNYSIQLTGPADGDVQEQDAQ